MCCIEEEQQQTYLPQVQGNKLMEGSLYPVDGAVIDSQISTQFKKYLSQDRPPVTRVSSW